MTTTVNAIGTLRRSHLKYIGNIDICLFLILERQRKTFDVGTTESAYLKREMKSDNIFVYKKSSFVFDNYIIKKNMHLQSKLRDHLKMNLLMSKIL
jgi:hypothetical protein